MRRLVLILVAAALATPAFAGQPVVLRPDTTDVNGEITLGDLFEGAGGAASQVIAHRTGPQARLDAGAVQRVAAQFGLDWANPDGIRKIIVSPRVGGAPARTAAGAAQGNRQVLVYAHDLKAGDIVGGADLVWTRAASAPADAPRDADAIIGMAAKRPLREGQAVSGRAVAAPIVVKGGDLITVTYDCDGVTLSLQAKAMTAGGVGETISVQNPTSQKVVQAVVTAPGEALVGPAAQQIIADRTARLASR